ncbi:MAG: ROK family protein [Acidimicrobiia bacterium]|nr:ROK family protein [Acidimicrobiia bacterium]
MPRTTGLRPHTKTPHEASRLGNRRLVLQSIFDAGPISRADLARGTELGRATVSEITGELIGEGLVVEAGQGTSTGGKPPTLVELDANGRFAVGVDLSRHPFEAALLDLRGRIVASGRGVDLAPTGRDALQEVHRLIADLIGDASAPALGIGVGIPGALDDNDGLVASPQLGWADVPLRDELEEVYGFPTYVVGDAAAAALAEFGRSGSEPESDLLYVKVDDRVTVGVVTAGQLRYTSRRGGDLTHVSMPELPNECPCGRRGCLGTATSLVEVLGPDYADLSSDDLHELAAPETMPELGSVARLLASVLAPTIATLDIDRLVIGGHYTPWASIPGLVAGAIEEILGWAPEVEASRLGGSAVVLGAGGMVLSGELGVVWG